MTLAQTISVLQFAQRAASGEFRGPAEFARALLCLALDNVSVEELRVYLSDEARARADAITDAAEALKLAIP